MKKIIAAALAAATAISASAGQTVPAFAEEYDFAADMQDVFAEPEMKYRPYARWWLDPGNRR